MKILTAAESRELDRLSQDKYGIASYALMTRAGEAVASAASRRWPGAIAHGVLVVAGKGNNGGDGFVAACRLLRGGARVSVLLLGRTGDLRGDAARACVEYVAAGGAVAEAHVRNDLESRIAGAGLVIDAIFGTGLKAEVGGLQRQAVEAINSSPAPVIAVDIPSGVNADTGAVMGAAVTASLTLTFGFAKFGHFSYPGAASCGELEIADIGFASEAIEEIAPTGRYLERNDVSPLLTKRPADSHKGMYGHALIIAGGQGKSGAVLLAARGALRMGAGLVTAAIPQSVATIVASGQAELMTEPIADRDGHFDFASGREALTASVAGKDALAVGPGIGVSDDTSSLVAWLVSEATGTQRPLVIDADALNVLAAIGPDIVTRARGPVVMTPHPGEMARLLRTTTAAVNADRISAARRLADISGACVLLKGARTVIASPDGRVAINSTGNPGMGTPGMGDVLTGMICALLGQRMMPIDSLMMGAWVHGAAADRAARKIGPVGYIATDLIEGLPSVLAELMA